jgi:putative nucleotidyltransferase with HDIG domain
VRILIKYKIRVSECKIGEILAEDIIVDGIKFVSKNTLLNSFILNKLLDYCIFEIIIYLKDEDLKLSYSKEETYRNFKNKYELSLLDIKSIINKIVAGGSLDHDTINHITDIIFDFSNYGSDVVKYLNSLKKMDEYTYTHCINVALYAMLIGRWMNLSDEMIKDLVQAGLLHDIGKLMVENKIITKPDRLTNSEFFEIKKHTIYGYDLINADNHININVKNAILMHHERLDGSGYPLGLKSKDIPLYTKIISVADVFDAMTSDRVYKKGTTPFKAFQMFMTEGVKIFDTSVLFILLENLSAYYIGMNAVLNSGEIGEIVYIPPKNILGPIIKVNDTFIDFSKEDISGIVNIV